MGESRAAEGVDDYGLARSRTRRTLGLPAGLSWKMRSVWPGPSQISRGGSEPTAGLTRVHWMILDWSNILLLALSGLGQISECPLCAKSGPSLTIIIYVRNIFGLATKELSHPSMMATSRATTSAVPPTADIVGQRAHLRKSASIGRCRTNMQPPNRPALRFWAAVPISTRVPAKVVLVWGYR